MAGPMPCLGYPSRTAAVVALRSAGHSNRAIAAQIGIPAASVAALAKSAQRAEGPRSAERGRTIVVPVSVLQLLSDAARRRGLSRETLAALIVETVAEEGLVDAVLDDGDAA